MKKMLESLKRDLWVIVLDVVAVNLSYYLALLIRFFVGGSLRAVAVDRYLPAWMGFTPWYTILSILIFAGWKLYGGLWRYAGVNDMNRIIGASVCTTVVHIAGTAIFFTRMPWTYYLIGGLLQFGFVVLIRFSYRILLVEKSKLSRSTRIPCVVVGSGDLGRKVVKHLESGGAYKPVLILSSMDAGRSLDGVPVAKLDVEKVRGLPVFIADKELSEGDRAKIKATASEFTDFTGALSNTTGFIPVSTLLSVVDGEVRLVLDGVEKKYASGAAALESLKERYSVKAISGARIELVKASSDGWVKDYQSATGEEVSFF